MYTFKLNWRKWVIPIITHLSYTIEIIFSNLEGSHYLVTSIIMIKKKVIHVTRFSFSFHVYSSVFKNINFQVFIYNLGYL
jgi:hypothetical protein